MDTKIIKQYGNDMLCNRLRTARQKKRMQYEDFDKQLIQLHKEEKALYLQKRNLGWEPLHPPVQKGWKRFFILREDVAAAKHAAFYQGILDKINTWEWSWRKDFLIKRRKRGKKIYVVKPQQLKQPWMACFTKLNFTEAEKNCFEEVWDFNWAKQPVKKMVFKESWRFVLVVKPNMIDKIRIKDAVLESRLDELDNYLERNNYRARLNKILHGKSRWKCWKQEEKYGEVYRYKNKSLNDTLHTEMQN